MHSLDIIISINKNPIKRGFRKPSTQSRECSHCTSKQGIVIHSAKCRDTVFVPRDASDFASISRRLDTLTGDRYNAFAERTYAKFSA